jgi:hypothetical protein
MRDIRRATRRHYSAQDNIRIVLEVLVQASRVPISPTGSRQYEVPNGMARHRRPTERRRTTPTLTRPG